MATAMKKEMSDQHRKIYLSLIDELGASCKKLNNLDLSLSAIQQVALFHIVEMFPTKEEAMDVANQFGMGMLKAIHQDYENCRQIIKDSMN